MVSECALGNIALGADYINPCPSPIPSQTTRPFILPFMSHAAHIGRRIMDERTEEYKTPKSRERETMTLIKAFSFRAAVAQLRPRWFSMEEGRTGSTDMGPVT